jgi:RNA polymerase sigma-70 factor (ECF subfamily)
VASWAGEGGEALTGWAASSAGSELPRVNGTETLAEGTASTSDAQPGGSAVKRDRAYAELFRAHHRRVEIYLRRRCGQGELARDLAAEVFRIAWERALEGRLPNAPWLFVTARNLLANAWRAEGRVAKLRHVLAVEATRDPNAQTARTAPADLADQHERVYQALDKLPEPQRELLTAHYWDGLSGAECAALIGCPPAAVWMRLTRARAAFKTIYAKLEDQS